MVKLLQSRTQAREISVQLRVLVVIRRDLKPLVVPQEQKCNEQINNVLSFLEDILDYSLE
jgi:hypothetical protein